MSALSIIDRGSEVNGDLSGNMDNWALCVCMYVITVDPICMKYKLCQVASEGESKKLRNSS